MVMSLKSAPLQLGVVTNNGEAMLEFYQETLQLPKVGEIPFPGLGVLYKLQCGENLIKVLVLDNPAEREAVRGGFTAAAGYRYCTLALTDLDETVAHCQSRGVAMVAEIRELRPGVRVALIADPDGNIIELFEEQE